VNGQVKFTGKKQVLPGKTFRKSETRGLKPAATSVGKHSVWRMNRLLP